MNDLVNVLEYIAFTLFVILGLFMICMGILIIKTAVTGKQRSRIVAAIHLYHMYVLEHHDWDSGVTPSFEVGYCDMEDFDKTLNRLWDWGYKRILPKEKLEIIKPFMNKEVKK